MSSRKYALVLGGTGSLGTTLVKMLLKDTDFNILAFSRDEAKHYRLRNRFPNQARLHHIVGDIRDYKALYSVLVDKRPTWIINAAALKQVPLCEEFPQEAVKTNVQGTMNLMDAIHSVYAKRDKVIVVNVGTDKAVKPINAYGASKALQEKLHVAARTSNIACIAVRYGNVLQSTGSVIPYFRELLQQGKRLPVTDYAMTRFLLSLDEAVGLIKYSIQHSEHNGTIFVPTLRSAAVKTVAEVLARAHGCDPAKTVYESAIRPGEKIHEILVSEEETSRLREQDGVFLIGPKYTRQHGNENDFSSGSRVNLLDECAVEAFLVSKGVLPCASASQVAAAS